MKKPKDNFRLINFGKLIHEFVSIEASKIQVSFRRISGRQSKTEHN